MSKHKRSGFTIVELLIVIVVIAILATISVVAYNGIQGRSRVTAVQTDLANAKKKLMLYNIDNDVYPRNSSEMTDADIKISSRSNYNVRSGLTNFYYCLNTASNEFAIGARAADGKPSSFYITSSKGVTPYTGIMSSNVTCSIAGLSGASSPQAYYSAGFDQAGNPVSWLQTGS